MFTDVAPQRCGSKSSKLDLKAARLATQTGAPLPDPAIRDWLQDRLTGRPDAAEVAADVPAGPLAAAALAVIAAARTYERVAKSGAA